MTTHLPRIIHDPPAPDGILPCCGKLSTEVPTYDRRCQDPAKVTCRKTTEEKK